VLERIPDAKIEFVVEELAIENNQGAISNKHPQQYLPHEKIARHLFGVRSDARARPKTGDNFLAFMDRGRQLLEKFNEQYEGQTVVLFSHGMFINNLRVLLRDRQLIDSRGLINWLNNKMGNSQAVVLSDIN